MTGNKYNMGANKVDEQLPAWYEFVIETKEVIEKLRNIKEEIPNPTIPEIYPFAEQIANHLDKKVSPAGFNNAAILALNDLTIGKERITGEIIKDRIYPDDTLRQRILTLDIPNIASYVCPSDFAKFVKDYGKDLKRDICYKGI